VPEYTLCEQYTINCIRKSIVNLKKEISENYIKLLKENEKCGTLK